MNERHASWIQRLVAISQTGLAYSPAEFDRQRFEQIRQIAAEMASHPDGRAEGISAVFASMTGHQTPKIVVRAAVFDSDDRLLMVKEAADGLWTVPGGWVDVGDSPASAVIRETKEETGIDVDVVKLVALSDKNRYPHPVEPHHAYIAFFLCRPIGGELRTSVETTDVGWFGESEIPPLSVKRTVPEQIARLFAHHRDLNRPADFD